MSEECDHCYAATIAEKYGRLPGGWGPGKPRRLTSDQNWMQPLRWNERARERRRRTKVFCGSMMDVFDPEVPDEWRRRLFELIEATPWLDWQLLTKRPNQIRRLLRRIGFWNKLPMLNVWLGFTAGAQKFFDRRWPIVRDIPATIRFCSYEPALGPLKLPADVVGRLHWLICGGETAPKKGEGRPMDLDWARGIRNQCRDLGVRFFFKQTGNWIQGEDGLFTWHGKGSRLYRERHDLLDGRRIQDFPRITMASNGKGRWSWNRQ